MDVDDDMKKPKSKKATNQSKGKSKQPEEGKEKTNPTESGLMVANFNNDIAEIYNNLELLFTNWDFPFQLSSMRAG